MRLNLSGTSLLLFASLGFGQWQTTNFPVRADIPALLVKGSDLYAASNGGGVFRSADKGGTWTALDSGLTDKYVQCLVFNGAKLFAGTPIGVYVSANAGTAWTQAGSGFTALNYIQALATDGAFVYATVTNSTLDNGVWKMPLTVTARRRGDGGRARMPRPRP